MTYGWQWISSHVLQNRVKWILKDGFVDLIIAFSAYSVAFLLRAVTIPLDYDHGLRFIVFAVFVHAAMLYGWGVYQRIWSKTSGHSISLLAYAVGSAALVILPVDFFLRPRPLPLSVVAVATVLALFGFSAVRFRSRLLTGLLWRWQAIWNYRFPKSRTRVLIVGAGDAGQIVAWRLKYHSAGYDYHVIGFIDDDPNKQNMYVEDCPILGTRECLVQLSDRYKIDLIVVAIHKIAGPEMRDILSRCEATKAIVKVVPNLFEAVNAKANSPQLRDVEAEDLIGRSVVARGEGIDFAPVTHKVILVTGAAGSIGSELSRQLVQFEPTKLVLLDCNESGLHDLCIELQARFPDLALVPVLADITVVDQVHAVFQTHHPEIVFHAAAYKHVPMLERYPNQGIRTNIGGTWQLAEFARESGVERFVLISTDKAVNPESVMGATKRVCELIVHALSVENSYQTLFTSVRFGNVLGSRGSVVPTFARQIDNGGPVTVTDERMTRYFMSIPEAANLVIHAACLTQGDDIFVLKMGEVVRIIDLAERMIRMRGLRPYIDIPIQITGMRPGEKMHEELYDLAEQPCDTIHPNIIQLHSWDDHFDVNVLLRSLESVLSRHFEDDASALLQLQDMTHFGYELTSAAD